MVCLVLLLCTIFLWKSAVCAKTFEMAENLRKPSPLVFNQDIAKSWEEFEEDWEVYQVAALSEKEAKVQAYTLLNLAGPEAIRRAKNFTYTGDETKEDPDVLLAKFRAMCSPQANVLMDTHLFFTCDQKTGQSIESYVNNLRLKANKCDFDTKKDQLIMSKFISGIQSDSLRRILLKEKDLTLKRAIEIAQLDEITKERLKLYSGNGASNACEVAAVSTECGQCGRDHPNNEECPAKHRQCNKCKRYGHFQQKCKTKTKTPVKYDKPRTYDKPRSYDKPKSGNKKFYKKHSKSVHVVEISDSEEEPEMSEFTIDSVGTTENQEEEAFVMLCLNGVDTELKVDSGAKINVISVEKLDNLSHVPDIDRSKRVMLRVYGGYKFCSLGAVQISCEYKGETHEMEFQVIDKSVRTLLCLADAKALGICDLSSDVYYASKDIFSVSVTEFGDYEELFSSELGSLPVVVKLEVDPKVTPVVRSAYRIPVALKPRVKQELDVMSQKGVISRVTEPTEWVSAMVVTKKKDKDELRICIDPRDLNSALKVPHHPLTTVDDVLKEIPNAKVFSVLDAKGGLEPASR